MEIEETEELRESETIVSATPASEMEEMMRPEEEPTTKCCDVGSQVKPAGRGTVEGIVMMWRWEARVGVEMEERSMRRLRKEADIPDLNYCRAVRLLLGVGRES